MSIELTMLYATYVGEISGHSRLSNYVVWVTADSWGDVTTCHTTAIFGVAQ